MSVFQFTYNIAEGFSLVKRGASIGANATIVCGIPLGEYAFIGAESVVTKNVPAYALELSLRQSCKATGLDVPMWNPFGIQ